MNKPIYLDNAATASICDAAKKAILDNLDDFYNPNSSYEPARKVSLKVEESREKIAELIGAEPCEVYFTSGGSESNSWVTSNYKTIASNIEHHSLMADSTFYAVTHNGVVDIEEYKRILKEVWNYWFNVVPTIASCMLVNNELGVIEPVKELAEITHGTTDMWFHTDAVQALPHMKINVKDLGVDMLSASGHKFNGPKGVGFLYAKKGIPLDPLINGGSQEQGIRGGTTNVLGVLAMAAALEDTVAHMDEINEKIAYLSSKIKINLLGIKGVTLNAITPETNAVEGILNLRIDGVKGADVVAMCSEYGVLISSGSACNEGNAEPSHVLKAIGLSDEEALSSIRISLGRYNTEQEIDTASKIIENVIKRLRLFS